MNTNVKILLITLATALLLGALVGCNRALDDSAEPTDTHTHGTWAPATLPSATTAPPHGDVTEATAATTTAATTNAATGGSTVDIQPEIQQEIKQAYLNQYHPSWEGTTESVRLRIFGEFDGTYALFVDCSGCEYNHALTLETVGGLTFSYPSTQKMLVYSGGTFYSLSEAFEQGILTQSELAEVHTNYTNRNN